MPGSVVRLSLVLGYCEVLQHTPRASTEAPPSEVTSPPLEAAEVVIAETAIVVMAGGEMLEAPVIVMLSTLNPV